MQYTLPHAKQISKMFRSFYSFALFFPLILEPFSAALAADHQDERKATFLAFPWTTGGVTKYGLANGDGQVISDPQWDFVDVFSYVQDRYFEEAERTILVMINKRYGLISDSGRIILQPVWDGLRPIAEGLAAAQKNGKWGFVDKTGRTVIPFIYEDAQRFSEGLAAIKVNGKIGYIDRTGKIVIPPSFNNGGRFYGGAARIDSGSGWGAINKSGSIIASPTHNNVMNEDSSLFLDVRGDASIYVDRSGRNAFPSATWNHIGFFDRGYAYISKDKKIGFIDAAGNIVVEPKWSDIGNQFGWLAGVRQKKLEGILDLRTGKFLVPLSSDYDGITPLPGGVIKLRKEKTWEIFYQDMSGKKIFYPDAECGVSVYKNRNGDVVYPRNFNAQCKKRRDEVARKEKEIASRNESQFPLSEGYSNYKMNIYCAYANGDGWHEVATFQARPSRINEESHQAFIQFLDALSAKDRSPDDLCHSFHGEKSSWHSWSWAPAN